MSKTDLSKHRSFALECPEGAKLWDYEKNGNLRPEHFLAKSAVKAWFKCENGQHDSRLSKIHGITLGYRCRQCTNERQRGTLKPVPPEQSILNLEIAKEWDYERNETLEPKHFSKVSHYKAHWICPLGHRYQREVRFRVKGSQCPVCRQENISNNLAKLEKEYPELLAQWHPQRNGDLTPVNVSASSTRQVWWKCDQCNHEFQTSIITRLSLARKAKEFSRKLGCAACNNTLPSASETHNLAHVFPDIAAEWHPHKNALLPTEFTPKSTKKVWWQCKTCNHEWESRIAARTGRGQGCPQCTYKPDKRFADKCPEAMKFWHPTKNVDIDPRNISYGSDKEAWWQCPDHPEHEWKEPMRVMGASPHCEVCYPIRTSRRMAKQMRQAQEQSNDD
jgi:hypothetical protein